MSKIKQIHPYGPKVGAWTVEPTVAKTIERERKRLKELVEAQALSDQEAKVKSIPIKRGRP